MNIHTAIRKGELILKENKIKTATLDSQILMSKAINEEKKFTILNCKNEISTENLDYYYDLVKQLLKQGYDKADIKSVIAKKNREWSNSEKMSGYIRPATLFGKKNFEQYLGELKEVSK